eukprot:5173797-Amphidinium_carterae.1
MAESAQPKKAAVVATPNPKKRKAIDVAHTEDKSVIKGPRTRPDRTIEAEVKQALYDNARRDWSRARDQGEGGMSQGEPQDWKPILEEVQSGLRQWQFELEGPRLEDYARVYYAGTLV